MRLKGKVLTFLVLAAVMFAGGCEEPNKSVKPEETENPAETDKYSKEYLGEWIRMDTGEKWYINGNTITVDGSINNKNVVLTRSGKMITVKEQGSPDYFLFASRIANGSFKSKLVIIDEGSANRSAGRALIPSGGVTIKPPSNPGLEQTVTPDPVTGEMEVEGIIPGDPVEITPLNTEWNNITVGVTPWDGYDMGIIPLAKGVNLKTTIRMANPSEDISVLFADEVPSNFILDVENIGTTNTTGASYELIMRDDENNVDFNRDFTLYSGSTSGLLDTIRPGEKRQIPISLGAKSIEEIKKAKKIGIRIISYDTQAQKTKTWEDFISINYYKVQIPFRFRSEKPVQGVILEPGGKTFYFKTTGHEGNYSYSIEVPWSNQDYLVAFLGASVETGSEARYSLAINDTAPSNWNSLIGENLFFNEPQNDNESAATNLDMEINKTFMGYLHDGDIDFYRINLGNVLPDSRIVDIENWAFAEVSGSYPFGNVKPGDTVNLDILFRNNSAENKTLTMTGLTADNTYAPYIENIRVPSYQLNLPIRHYGTLTSSATSADSTDVQLLNSSNNNRAFQFKLPPDAPSGIITFNLTFNDNSGLNYVKTLYVEALGIPTGVTATAASSSSINVSWSSVAGATGYRIYRSTNEVGTFTEVGTSSTTSYTDTGLTASTTYYYKVAAINSSGTGGQSNAVSAATFSVITIDTHPAATTNVIQGNISGSLSVSASVTGGATLSYQWYSNTIASNTGGTVINGATGSSYAIPTTLSGETYYYFVEVRATGGAASVRSNAARVNVAVPVITIDTQPAATTNVYTGSISGSLSVTASVTGGATLSYQWYSNTTASNTGGTVINGATGSSYTIPTTLTAGINYYFVEVRATGGAVSVRSSVARVNVNFTSPTSIELVRINSGTFTMGSPTSEANRYDDETQHQVTISKGFYMGKYEVTQEQYQAVIGVNPSYFSSDPASGEVQAKRPVENVTWYDAVEFCNKLSERESLTSVYTITGRTPATGYPITSATVTVNWNASGYRLPTEAEWEYACRAGTTTAYNTGNTISDSTGWYSSNSNSRTHEVGKKPPNAWGLYDMHGNVYEWCWDWYGTYASGAQTDPRGADSGSHRVHRGGSWLSFGPVIRSACRVSSNPYGRYYGYGFRLLRP